jgi:hypothetical protein
MPSRTLLVAALAAAGCLLAPAAAAADSIVYADRGDIWSMRPDGSGKVRSTDGGTWHSPTQADDGTIAAVQGTGPITVMARDGRRAAHDHDAARALGRRRELRARARRPLVLPRRVEDRLRLRRDVVSRGLELRDDPALDVLHARRRRPGHAARRLGQPVRRERSRVDHERPALVFGGYGSQVSIDDLGGGDYSFVNWLKPDTDQGDGELSRDGRKLATTFSYGENLILAFFAVSGDATQGPPPAATPACNSSSPDAALADPSWAPDSAGLAFQSRDGLETLRFTKLDATGCAVTGPSVVVAPTGSQPDWGPADPPAARFTAPAAPGPGPAPAPRPGTTPGTGPGAAGGGPGATRLSIVAGGPARQAFRGTLTVRCTAPVRARAPPRPR